MGMSYSTAKWMVSVSRCKLWIVSTDRWLTFHFAGTDLVPDRLCRTAVWHVFDAQYENHP